MTVAAIIFDFDGVLIDSEHAGNVHLAAVMTRMGRETSVEEACRRFSGLSGPLFRAAMDDWMGRAAADDLLVAIRTQEERMRADGVAAVAGAVDFVRSLPDDVARAVASSSRVRWIAAHLAHLGLADRFGDHLYSGHEHVANGKPAPDLYLYAADRLGVPIGDCVVLEDSVVGATGAVASGARVIGLCAGRHCDADHAGRLRAVGVKEVAADFDAVRAMLGWRPAKGSFAMSGCLSDE